MVVYAYVCADCDQQTLSEHPIGKAPDSVPCKLCKGTTRRQFFPTPTHFKGRGWGGRP